MAPTGATDEEEVEAAKAANRFDIRRLVGGLFILYSLILIVLGIFGSHHIRTKAAGINVDLWTGIGMLIFGILMLFWALSRPVMPEPAVLGESARLSSRIHCSSALRAPAEPTFRSDVRSLAFWKLTKIEPSSRAM